MACDAEERVVWLKQSLIVYKVSQSRTRAVAVRASRLLADRRATTVPECVGIGIAPDPRLEARRDSGILPPKQRLVPQVVVVAPDGRMWPPEEEGSEAGHAQVERVNGCGEDVVGEGTANT